MLIKILLAWFAVSVLFAWFWMRFFHRAEPQQGE
jgi:membrane protein implicated in regulation of membrane protease activity